MPILSNFLFFDENKVLVSNAFFYFSEEGLGGWVFIVRVINVGNFLRKFELNCERATPSKNKSVMTLFCFQTKVLAQNLFWACTPKPVLGLYPKP